MVTEEFIERWVGRLRDEIPDAVAIFLVGSVVRGEPGAFSDVDFDVVVPDEPSADGPTWLVVEGDRVVCVSVWVRQVAQWLEDENRAQNWALHLRSEETVQLRWAADDEWRSRLGRSRISHPAGPPELEHVLGNLAKVANAHARGDDLALRLAAQDVARDVPTLLQPVNPHPPVVSQHAALLAALAFDTVPTGYRDDLLTCFGLTGTATTADDVYAAAYRLTLGTVGALETHRETVAPLLSPQLAASLEDGFLRRYVAQMAPTA
jgi:hypothetical protein